MLTQPPLQDFPPQQEWGEVCDLQTESRSESLQLSGQQRRLWPQRAHLSSTLALKLLPVCAGPHELRAIGPEGVDSQDALD